MFAQVIIFSIKIQLCLDKVQERWWEAAFDGEDKLNTRKIDCSRPMHELDDEAQAKIQQLMYDEQRKRQGLLTSEQEVSVDSISICCSSIYIAL